MTEEELLAWLALGAASRREGRPLLRPVIHAFVSGVAGAVVTFPPDHAGPRLWLSAEAEAAAEADEGDDTGDRQLYRFPVTTCGACGQHYFVHHVADLRVTAKGLEGGTAIDDRWYWEAIDATLDGASRVVLLDNDGYPMLSYITAMGGPVVHLNYDVTYTVTAIDPNALQILVNAADSIACVAVVAAPAPALSPTALGVALLVLGAIAMWGLRGTARRGGD